MQSPAAKRIREQRIDAAIAHLDRIAALHRRTLLCRRLGQFPNVRYPDNKH